MANETFSFRQMKIIYDAFYDKDGRLLEEPVGALSRMELSEEQFRFLRAYIEFMVNSDATCKYAKIYLKSPAHTLRDAFKNWNYMHPDNGVNINTAISNMDYNRKALLKLFSEDHLSVVMSENTNVDMTEYWEALDNALQKYSKTKFFDSLSIKLSKVASTKVPEQEDIDEFRRAIYPYTKQYRTFIEKEINSKYRDVIGYLNYLSSKVRTDEEDKIYNAFLEEMQ